MMLPCSCLKFAQSSKDLIKRLTDQAKDQDQDGSFIFLICDVFAENDRMILPYTGVSLSAMSSLGSPIDFAVNLV